MKALHKLSTVGYVLAALLFFTCGFALIVLAGIEIWTAIAPGEDHPVKERFQALSLEALPGTPEQMEAYVASERERWGKVIRANSIRAD